VVDEHNQASLPPNPVDRGGTQPVVTLAVNGTDHASVGVGQAVTLTGKIEAPPKTGRVVQYDWYLVGSPVTYERRKLRT
jgi:hypothetical protein